MARLELLYLEVELVGQRLKVDGGSGNLLSVGGVVAVGQMATRGQVQAHDPVVGLQNACVGREIGRTATKTHSLGADQM